MSEAFNFADYITLIDEYLSLHPMDLMVQQKPDIYGLDNIKIKGTPIKLRTTTYEDLTRSLSDLILQEMLKDKTMQDFNNSKEVITHIDNERVRDVVTALTLTESDTFIKGCVLNLQLNTIEDYSAPNFVRLINGTGFQIERESHRILVINPAGDEDHLYYIGNIDRIVKRKPVKKPTQSLAQSISPKPKEVKANAIKGVNVCDQIELSNEEFDNLLVLKKTKALSKKGKLVEVIRK